MYSQKLFVLSAFLYIIFPSALTAPPDSLRQVVVLYRHGDRSPMMSFPTDEHKENSWPQGFGWLSNIGKQQQYHVGKFLRDRYDGFLNTTYDHREITVQSSSTERCLMSAYSNLAGLYPPVGDQIWDKDLLWQPIPVETKPGDEDKDLHLGKACPRYDQLYEQEMRSHEVTEEEIENKPFYEFIDKMTGIKRENISSIWSVADTLICENIHNKTAPTWLNETVFEKLKDLLSFSFYIKFGKRDLARLKGGPLLKKVIVNFQQKITGKDKTKFYMYSAHDITVCSFLSAMEVYNRLSPPYAATVITELHEQPKGKYFIRIFYKNTTADVDNYMNAPTQLFVPGCPGDCPYDSFVSLLSETIPIDWDEECKVTIPGPAPLGPLAGYMYWMIGVSVGLVICTLVLVAIGHFVHKKKELGNYETITAET